MNDSIHSTNADFSNKCHIDPPIDGMKTIPYGIPLMLSEWMSLVLWLAGQKQYTDTFKKETGLDITALTRVSPIEVMIDTATGHQKTVIIAWADWVTENEWGEL